MKIEEMKENKKLLIIAGILLVLVIVTPLIFMGINYHYYAKLSEGCNEVVDLLNEEVSSITKLQKAEEQYEETLHSEMQRYYVSITAIEDKSMEQEVFCRVFKSYFPTKKDIMQNKKQSFIKIYALLENYPEMQKDTEIAKALNSIEATTEQLTEEVDLYNYHISEYNKIVDRINSSEWVKVRKHLRIPIDLYPYAIIS